MSSSSRLPKLQLSNSIGLGPRIDEYEEGEEEDGSSSVGSRQSARKQQQQQGRLNEQAGWLNGWHANGKSKYRSESGNNTTARLYSASLLAACGVHGTGHLRSCSSK